MKAASASYDRVTKMIKAYKEGKDPIPQQMVGGTKSANSSRRTSSKSTNKYMLASTFSKSAIG